MKKNSDSINLSGNSEFINCYSNKISAFNKKNIDTISTIFSKYEYRLNISPFYLKLRTLPNNWNLGFDFRYIKHKTFDIRASYYHSFSKYIINSNLINDLKQTHIISVGLEREAGKIDRRLKYYYGVHVGYVFLKGKNFIYSNYHSEYTENYFAIGIYNGLNYDIGKKINIGFEFSLDGLSGKSVETFYQTTPREKLNESSNTLFFEPYSIRPLFLYLTFKF